MKPQHLIAIAIALIIGFIGAYFFLKGGSPQPHFIDQKLDEGLDDLVKRVQNPTFGLVLKIPGGMARNVSNFVGAIIVQDSNDNSAAPELLTGEFRPGDDGLQVDPVDESLFEGKVSNKMTSKAGLEGLSASLDIEDVAEIVIRNQLLVTWKDKASIPWQKLRTFRLQPGKRYWFIESVTLTTVTSRSFHKVGNSTEISGTAFKAGGEIYSSNSGHLVKNLLVAQLYDLHRLRAGDAGSDTAEVTKILGQDEVNQEDSQRLLQLLKRPSFDSAIQHLGTGKSEVRIEAVIPDRQGSKRDKANDNLSDQGVRRSNANDKNGFAVRIEGVWPIRQASPTDCWAAATAMLCNWNRRHFEPPDELLRRTARDFVGHLKDHLPLAFEDKEAFLAQIGLVYEPGASYLPIAVVEMLRQYGPLWFTVSSDNEYSVHASIVVGMLRSDGDWYVTFIDPRDGLEHDERYDRFHARYEAPARFMNEDAYYRSVFVDGRFYPVHVAHFARAAVSEDARALIVVADTSR